MKDQFSLCTYNSKGHYDLSKSFGCQFAVVEGHITCFLHLFRTLVFLSLKNVTTYAKIYHNSYVGEPLASYMCVCAHQCVRNNEHCNGLHVCWFCVCVCVFVWDKEVRGTVRERVCVCVWERERNIRGTVYVFVFQQWILASSPQTGCIFNLLSQQSSDSESVLLMLSVHAQFVFQQEEVLLPTDCVC